MKPALIALLMCLCLPLVGADKEKPLPKDIPSLKVLAEKGDARAQNELGWRYSKGQGVPYDDVTAYAWWNIAALSGRVGAKKFKRILAKKMTPQTNRQG